MKSHFLRLLLAFYFCFFGLVACNQAEDSNSTTSVSEWTHVVNANTEYYKGGPQQASPPDGELLKGTQVKLIQEAGSYSEIEAESGESGYVSSGALVPIQP